MSERNNAVAIQTATTELSEAGEIPFAIGGYRTLGFYGDIDGDEKARTKFIKNVVKIIRSCPEYARYRKFIIENLDMNRCSILSNLTVEESLEAKLEIHHAPLALYDIAEVVMGKMIYDRVPITMFSIANRVMAYHWMGKVGLVPVSLTIHEAIHAGQLFVDPRTIYGNWAAFLHENKEGVSEHVREKIAATVGMWEDPEFYKKNAEVLKVELLQWTGQIPTEASMLRLAHETVSEDVEAAMAAVSELDIDSALE